ncbi:MAG: precorrin-6Y C5,15-methyltransferase (decarboxylating) subunit CbiT, partial [Huintestinicola sp.]
ENLGTQNERITSAKAYELIGCDTDKLSVLITVNKNYVKTVLSGIEESRFERGSVPMTKAEVRTVCISKLGIASDSICWDVGCGTGSVSVEMAVRCPEGKVFAIDRNDEAVGLTRKNSRSFHCDNIHVCLGEADDILTELPPPHCVMIGGSRGSMDSIIAAALEKNPRARFVITAVSLETLGQAETAFEKYGIVGDIIQIAVTRTKKAGSHTMLSAENPVFIISGSKSE